MGYESPTIEVVGGANLVGPAQLAFFFYLVAVAVSTVAVVWAEAAVAVAYVAVAAVLPVVS